jgi:putative SOS response-associated peptidase YedK
MCGRYRLARKQEILAEIFDAVGGHLQITAWSLLSVR